MEAKMFGSRLQQIQTQKKKDQDPNKPGSKHEIEPETQLIMD